MSCGFAGLILVGECLRNQSHLTLAVWLTKPAFHFQLNNPSPGELGSVLKSAPWVAFAEIVSFQQLGYAFIIVVHPVLRLLYDTLSRTRCGGPCSSLFQIWHSLPSGPEDKLWQVNEIGKPVGMVESGLVYSSGED